MHSRILLLIKKENVFFYNIEHYNGLSYLAQVMETREKSMFFLSANVNLHHNQPLYEGTAFLSLYISNESSVGVQRLLSTILGVHRDIAFANMQTPYLQVQPSEEGKICLPMQLIQVCPTPDLMITAWYTDNPGQPA